MYLKGGTQEDDPHKYTENRIVATTRDVVTKYVDNLIIEGKLKEQEREKEIQKIMNEMKPKN
mgnify:CR=1 FL=1